MNRSRIAERVLAEQREDRDKALALQRFWDWFLPIADGSIIPPSENDVVTEGVEVKSDG